jgi:hypothetical protein
MECLRGEEAPAGPALVTLYTVRVVLAGKKPGFFVLPPRG